MDTNAIRILDEIDGYLYVTLIDILDEIQNGNLFQWSILYLEATGHLGEGKSIVKFEKEITDLKEGLYVTWDELSTLSKKFDQIIDIIIIASRNTRALHRYTNNYEMYEACDIVIQLIDSSYWEIFSKDKSLIDRLFAKFKEVKILNSREDLGEV